MLRSAGESVSGLHAFRKAGQIAEADFAEADALSYRIENGLARLIQRVEEKRAQGDWDESFIVQESNAAYGERADDWVFLHPSTHPFIHPSTPPSPEDTR